MPAEPDDNFHSFLGTGWSFPPTFEHGAVLMTSDEEDIRASLGILFGTAPGERMFEPKFGVDVRALVFEPMSTTLRTLAADDIRTLILVHEPRIRVLRLEISTPDANEGRVDIALDYQVRTTNSRFNLVFPFYRSDANEIRASADALP